RVQRAQRRRGAVAAHRPRQRQLADILAVEHRRTLRPGGAANSGAEQQAQSQPFCHKVLPATVALGQYSPRYLHYTAGARAGPGALGFGMRTRSAAALFAALLAA